MSPRSQRRDPFAYGNSRRGTFSAWTMAIVFATVAMVSFAIDQTLSLAPNAEEQNMPFLLQGDANSAQVGYSGEIEGATLVARQHCAQYERVPLFLEAEENVAFF